jgi:hypothetical protein
MRVSTVEILGSEGAFCPSLGLARQTRDALARYVALRWPTDRRKSVAAEFGLSRDEARSVCEATASATTIDKIWKSPRGGWSVLLPVMGAVIGQTIEDFHQQEVRNHAAQARRHASLARDLRALRSPRAGHGAELDARPAEGRRIVVRRLAAGRDQATGGVK